MSATRQRISALAVLLVAGAAVQAKAAAEQETSRKPGESRRFDGIEFVWVPAGRFLMGSSSEEASFREQPFTHVRISRGFWLGKHELTQSEWQGVMGTNPSLFSGCGRCPVENVSWHDAQEFIGKLNARKGEKNRYRLPTEAEWEYAARAGTGGDRYGELAEIAWWDFNRVRPQPVGQKAPNAWELYDMLGNVDEWVEDWYGKYPGGLVTDPGGPASGSERMVRGCNWSQSTMNCRTPGRSNIPPGARGSRGGFRLLRTE